MYNANVPPLDVPPAVMVDDLQQMREDEQVRMKTKRAKNRRHWIKMSSKWLLSDFDLIFPFLELDIKYFDLDLPNQDATDDKVTIESAEATLKYNVAIKCATITPGWTKPICIGRHAFGDQYRATDTVIKGAGKLKLMFVAEDERKTTVIEVFNFKGAGGVALSMYNTDESIRTFAEASMNTAYQKKWPLYLSTNNTVLKKYDRRFKDIFQEVYESKWKSKFEEAGICYIGNKMCLQPQISQYTLTGFVSIGLMTPILVCLDRKTIEAEVAHGTVTRHYRVHQKGGETSTNSIASIFAWTRGLAHRAKLDDNAKLSEFTEKLEAACVATVESGKMTKDLALIIHGSKIKRVQYLKTEEFIDVVVDELKERLKRDQYLNTEEFIHPLVDGLRAKLSL
ncbi:Cytosolic isocitrate dehydrogenase [NADP] [Abeliophyllum distichum]|uniref:Isocitrate dehydrogenase [NADP] n=1 Tax=Abeliophyllum distichum TaxID=126358 RepID=A0ABD1V1H8_9LAMI